MAFAEVISKPKISGVVNVGNPETISIRDVGSIIGQHLKKEKLLEYGALDYRPDQVMKLQPLCETLVNAGWQPQISFDVGIRQTIDWLQRKQLMPITTEDGKTLNFNLPLRP
jgi:nucleoside-diphosphate-sugar epimerase